MMWLIKRTGWDPDYRRWKARRQPMASYYRGASRARWYLRRIARWFNAVVEP